jgi:hypothetical protein
MVFPSNVEMGSIDSIVGLQVAGPSVARRARWESAISGSHSDKCFQFRGCRRRSVADSCTRDGMKVARVPMREDEADLEPVVDVFFAPQLRHSDLPVETAKSCARSATPTTRRRGADVSPKSRTRKPRHRGRRVGIFDVRVRGDAEVPNAATPLAFHGSSPANVG